MPGGTWSAEDVYEGKLYRTTGSPFHAYDALKFKVIEAGIYRFRFAGETGTFEYTVDGRRGSLPLVRQLF
jgi:hypothetical protein